MPDFVKAIDLEPSYAEAYYMRGVANLALENHIEAKEDLSKAFELAKDSGKADLIQKIEELFTGLLKE